MGVLPGVRVRTTLWLTSGLVSSQPSAAAAANTLLTPGMMDAATPFLLGDRAVHGGIAGVQAHDTFPGKGGIAHGFDLFPQIHGGAIEAGAIGFAGLEVGGVDQRTRVDHEIRLFQSAQATHGDEILRARSGADEFDECFHEIASLWNVNT